MADTLAEVKKIAQRALDVQEIQNLMSRHAYFVATASNRKELETIWAQKAPDVKWTNPQGIWVGMESLKEFYADACERNQQAALERVIKLHPEVENKKENWGAGYFSFHPLTTPIIEVAGDGKTAKGVWYSPGIITEVGPDGNPWGVYCWAKYGVDFIKEDGEWKIWHLHRYYDLMFKPGESWAQERKAPPSDPPPIEMPEPDEPGFPYEAYTPTTVPQYEPRPPEPYYTFSETFSY